MSSYELTKCEAGGDKDLYLYLYLNLNLRHQNNKTAAMHNYHSPVSPDGAVKRRICDVAHAPPLDRHLD